MNSNKNMSIWQGKCVRLRAIEPADWEIYFAWNFDDEMTSALYSVPFPQSQETVKRWVEMETLKGPEGDNYRFVIENLEGAVVGDISVHHCDVRVGKLSYGLNIKQDYRRKGYASEAILLVLRYYFQELRYQKVTVGVYSFNEPPIRLHETLGFQQEGRVRCTVYTKGQYFDELIYGMTKEEFFEHYTACLP